MNRSTEESSKISIFLLSPNSYLGNVHS